MRRCFHVCIYTPVCTTSRTPQLYDSLIGFLIYQRYAYERRCVYASPLRIHVISMVWPRLYDSWAGTSYTWCSSGTVNGTFGAMNVVEVGQWTWGWQLLYLMLLICVSCIVSQSSLDVRIWNTKGSVFYVSLVCLALVQSDTDYIHAM